MRARERRDDAAGHRLADAERIADGEHEIADLETVRIAELDRGELHAARIEPQHGEIGLLVLEDDLGRELPPVGERHGDLGIAAPLNDVVVGNDHALRRHQHAGAERVLDALARDAEPLAEQPPEERIVEEGRDHLLDPVPHIDVNHGGGGPLHHRREGLLHRHGALRHRALLRGSGHAERQERQDGRQSGPAIFTW